MRFYTEYLTFKTTQLREYINITPQVEEVLRKSQMQEGMILVSAMHITAGVWVNDAEDGLIADIDEWLDKLAPFRREYRHHRTGETNGDAHLKNFAVLYDDRRVWLSPVYDQVTTVLYTYERPGGIETVDHTMALKLRRGGRSGEKSAARTYPARAELESFGRDVCGVHHPAAVIEQSCQAMSEALAHAHPAVPVLLRERIGDVWDQSREWMGHRRT